MILARPTSIIVCQLRDTPIRQNYWNFKRGLARIRTRLLKRKKKKINYYLLLVCQPLISNFGFVNVQRASFELDGGRRYFRPTTCSARFTQYSKKKKEYVGKKILKIVSRPAEYDAITCIFKNFLHSSRYVICSIKSFADSEILQDQLSKFYTWSVNITVLN